MTTQFGFISDVSGKNKACPHQREKDEALWAASLA